MDDFEKQDGKLGGNNRNLVSTTDVGDCGRGVGGQKKLKSGQRSL